MISKRHWTQVGFGAAQLLGDALRVNADELGARLSERRVAQR